MERLREKWPHTLILDFAPEGAAGRLRRRPAAAGRRCVTRSRSAACSWSSPAGGPADDAHARGARARPSRPRQHAEAGRLMRLHSLELSAFGPYARTQRVDFDRLSSSGLFLLEGPTGVGQDDHPGRDHVRRSTAGWRGRSRPRTGSAPISPRPTPSPRSPWSSRCAGVRHRVTRVPEHRRPKRRGDGFATEPAHVHLQRRDGGGWVSLSANKAEAGELITELIGLNRAQFTQVMLLPQGQFAKLPAGCGRRRRRSCSASCSAPSCTTASRPSSTGAARRGPAARQAAEAAIDAATSAAAEAAGLDAAARAGLSGAAWPGAGDQLKQVAADLAAGRGGERRGPGGGGGRDRHPAGRRPSGEQQQARLMARLTEALRRRWRARSVPARARPAGRAAGRGAARRTGAAPARRPAEAQQAVREARDGLLRLVPDPDDAMLAGRRRARRPSSGPRRPRGTPPRCSISRTPKRLPATDRLSALRRRSGESRARPGWSARWSRRARSCPARSPMRRNSSPRPRLLAAGLGAARAAAGRAGPAGGGGRRPGRAGAAARGPERGRCAPRWTRTRRWPKPTCG